MNGKKKKKKLYYFKEIVKNKNKNKHSRHPYFCGELHIGKRVPQSQVYTKRYIYIYTGNI